MADLAVAEPQACAGLGRGARGAGRAGAVGPAAVVEAGDRLLADVAALGEADGALDDARLGRHRLGARSRRRSGAGRPRCGGSRRPPRSTSTAPARGQCGAQALGLLGRRRSGRSPRRCRRPGSRRRRRRRSQARGKRGRGGDPGRPAPGRSARAAPRSASTSAISTSRPILYVSRWRRVASSACGSVSSQMLVLGEPQHPHVGLHVALAVEQRRVAALAGRQRLDVVGQLALQVLGRLRPADDRACRGRSGRAARTPRAAAGTGRRSRPSRLASSRRF